MVTTYTLDFRHFSHGEASRVLHRMTREFPGYSSHDVISSTSAVRRYEYVTTATAATLYGCLGRVLDQMGLDPDRDAEIQVHGATITLHRL